MNTQTNTNDITLEYNVCMGVPFFTEESKKYMQSKGAFTDENEFVSFVKAYLDTGAGFEIEVYDETDNDTSRFYDMLGSIKDDEILSAAKEYYTIGYNDLSYDHEHEDYFTKAFALEAFYRDFLLNKYVSEYELDLYDQDICVAIRMHNCK